MPLKKDLNFCEKSRCTVTHLTLSYLWATQREEQRLKEVEKDFFDMISSGEDTAAATAPAPA